MLKSTDLLAFFGALFLLAGYPGCADPWDGDAGDDDTGGVPQGDDDTADDDDTAAADDTADDDDDGADDDDDTAARWDSSTRVLHHYGDPATLAGFSGTTTEYLFDGLGMATFWDTDFSTPFQATTSRVSMAMLSSFGQANFTTIYEHDMGTSGDSPEPQNVANRYFAEGIVYRLAEAEYPVFRIPLTARYWLNGGKKVYTYEGQVVSYDGNSQTVTYSWGSTGVLTGDVELIEDGGQYTLVQYYTAQEYQQYITDLIYYIKEEVPDCVIILDLHWNYDRFGDPCHSDDINDETTESTVYAKQLPMATDRDATGNQIGSAVLLWQSVSETFGIRGGSLVDGVKADAAAPYTNHIRLSDNPQVDADYASDIWFELYNEPHTDKFSSYWVHGDTPVPDDDNTTGATAADWSHYIHGVASGTDMVTFAGMKDLYAAVRDRSDNHVVLSAGSNYAWGWESLVALHDAIDADAAMPWNNVLLNIHPYMGYYQKADGAKDAEGFYDVVSALWALDAPLIITEFGQYDGPDKIHYNGANNTAVEPDDNWYFSGTGDLSVSSMGNPNRYEWYHYDGYWDSAASTETGTPMSYVEAILQICEDHQISWSAWASRPNGFSFGSSTGATQPDVFTGVNGGGNDEFQLTNPTTAINIHHQSQPMVKDTATGGGANWAYLWDRFAAGAP